MPEYVQSVLKKTCFITRSTGHPLFFHMFSTPARGHLSPTVLAAALLVCLLSPTATANGDGASLFRIFLADGASLVSYGEFARVGDRVVFSVPVGDPEAEPTLHVVSIPSSVVDWPRTDHYAVAVRAKRYADTRGEEDFALLASRVTQALNDIHLTADPVRRLAMAEEARRNLAAWPAANYGYRAADIARLVGMLDEVVTGLQAATGKTPFELSLVATTIEPPSFVELQPTPGVDAAIESAFRAAMVSPVPGERIDLLRGIASALERMPQSPFRTSLRATASTFLDTELKVERAYEELTRTAIRDADQRVARGDANGLQQIIARALATDDRLGRQRMAEMSALLAALDLRLTEANRVRLAQEAWKQRLEYFKEYRRATESVRRQLKDLGGDLREIRDRKTPSFRALHRLEIRSTMVLHDLNGIQPPPELHAIHGQMVTALQLARQAAVLRRDATTSKITQRAWEASSAAAGALMLAERAETELRAMLNAEF